MRINSKIFILSCAAVISFSSSAIDSVATPGQLSMSGELIESACEMGSDQQDRTIDFGAVTARDINFKNEDRLSHSLSIRISGCPTLTDQGGRSHYPLASVTFLGNMAGGNPGMLDVDGSGKGFGIRIRDRNGVVLMLGQKSPGYDLSQGNGVLHFTVTLVPASTFIKAGDFIASARFFIDYE